MLTGEVSHAISSRGAANRYLRPSREPTPLPSVEGMVRTVAAALLALYCLVIARLTLTDPSGISWVFDLADRTATEVSGGRLDWSRTEVLANVALFVPAGLLLVLVLGGTRPGLGTAVLPALALCVLGSVAIEAAQTFLPTRVPSPADVLHNGYGAALGAAAAWLFSGARVPSLHSADR